jgi:hypothetical protein
MEMFVVREDKDRLWSADAEWVHNGTNFYGEAVRRMGEISGGMLHPEQIEERWTENEEGGGWIIEVSFNLRGSGRHVWLTRQSDFAHRGFVTVVNSMLEPGPRRFRLYGDSQDWYVVFQDDEDTKWMEARGWVLFESSDVANVLEFPLSMERGENSQGNPWLYFRRGMFQRDTGDEEGAWADWIRAHQLGMGDLYERVAAMDE